MIRAVVDVNVFVSAVLTPGGTPHRLLERWREGAFEIVVSEALLGELERVLDRREIAARADQVVLRQVLTSLRRGGVPVDDPPVMEPLVPRDRKDDYLVALARAAGAHVIVTGDRHLLEVEGLRPPALEPRGFLAFLERAGG